MTQPTQRTIATPVVSFSTLAKVMGPVSTIALAAKLRAHKYPTDGQKRSYQNATKQAVDNLVSGTVINPHARNLRPHEKEALLALATMGVALPAGAQATRPSTRGPTWTLSGVTVSMYPDADLTASAGTGAVKYSFSKEHLARGVGTAMAALLWHYRTVVLGQANVSPSLCLVYEPRVGATYRPGANPAGQVRNAQVACQIIAAVWPTL